MALEAVLGGRGVVVDGVDVEPVEQGLVELLAGRVRRGVVEVAGTVEQG